MVQRERERERERERVVVVVVVVINISGSINSIIIIITPSLFMCLQCINKDNIEIKY